jgi:serpin B
MASWRARKSAGECRRARKVDVTFPRFKTTSNFSLIEAMKALGMERAFGPGADFSGMTKAGPLFIDEILHEACVVVDELGTEATAGTGVIMYYGSSREDPVVFRADRPFLYLIRHRDTGAILFLGRLVNPGTEGKAAAKS